MTTKKLSIAVAAHRHFTTLLPMVCLILSCDGKESADLVLSDSNDCCISTNADLPNESIRGLWRRHSSDIEYLYIGDSGEYVEYYQGSTDNSIPLDCFDFEYEYKITRSDDEPNRYVINRIFYDELVQSLFWGVDVEYIVREGGELKVDREDERLATYSLVVEFEREDLLLCGFTR